MSGASAPRANAGTHDGPISPDAWKRAIYRRAPTNFHVKLLPPEKQGSSYSYGFRVYPIHDNARATSSSDSIAALCEYDIWRKWEDCLHFQDTLEVEYARAAREKRNRLAAGKGVKKNGVYIHSDQAASWESLPFGPDPDDVARDIHDYIPKLSKKGTFFRASQETVDNRFDDLQKMMSALLQEDLPTLIKEIKETRIFTDFFGIWRRDMDLARKAEPSKRSTADRPRPSLPTGTLSLPHSPSLLSVKSLSPTKGKAPERPQVPLRASTHSDSSSSEDSADPQRPSRSMDRRQEVHSMRSRASSSGSHSSSSLPSTPVAAPRQLPPSSRQPVIASQEVPIRFGHNPHVLGGERASSYLESLPEDREFSSSPKSERDSGWSRKRSGSTTSRMHRNASIYVPSSSSSLHSSESPTESSSRLSYRHTRTSLQSTHSSATLRAAAYLDELDVDYCLPSPTPEPRCMPRASVSSLASVMTNASVDAVIPRSERPSRSSRNNTQRPLSQPEESWREYDQSLEDQPEDQADILDAYFYDLIGPESPTPNGYPETPSSMYHFPEKQSSTTVSSYSRHSDRRSSLATSISSGSTSSSGNPMMLSVKAMHEENIIMLRVSRYITFDDLRRKIYEKFIQSDKATICETFAVALLEQPPAERPRAASLSSLGSGHSKGATLHFISSQDEWDDVVATHSGKILLRIIGSRE